MKDTGRVPFIARACSACNNEFEASHKLAILCNNMIVCMDGMHSALTPTTDKIECSLTPYIDNIGRALLLLDKELFPEDCKMKNN